MDLQYFWEYFSKVISNPSLSFIGFPWDPTLQPRAPRAFGTLGPLGPGAIFLYESLMFIKIQSFEKSLRNQVFEIFWGSGAAENASPVPVALR